MKYSLSSWSGGIDEVSPVDSAAFQLPDPKAMFESKSPIYLRSADNILIDNTSKPRRRSGTSSMTSLTDGKSIIATKDYIFFQDGSSLMKYYNPTGDVTLAKSLNSNEALTYLDYTDGTYYFSSTDQGRIAGGSALNWGCSAPTTTVSTTAGSLPIGTYKVASTCVDSSGIEHGAGPATEITLSSPAGLSVSATGIDSNAVSLRFYATKADQRGLFYVGSAAVGSLPVAITAVDISEYRLKTQFLSPPEDISCLFDYRGMLIHSTGNYLYPSLGVNHHLFDKKTVVEARPSTVLAGVGLKSGFWSVCERGAFWTTGANPKEWDTIQVDDFKYAKGSKRVPGYLVGIAGSKVPVALFVSEHGLCIGTNTGEMLPVHHDRLRLDVANKKASFAYNRSDLSNQILFSLE